MKVWLYRKDAGFQDFFRPDVEVRFLEDGGAFSNDKDVLFVHEGDACPEGISQACCRKIEFEQKKLHQCLLQPLAKNYDAGWLKYQLRRTDPFDTVVAGSSYPMFGLDMQQLPSWRNLSLASQDFYYAILLLKKLYEHQPYRRVVLGHYYYTIFSDLSRTENPGEIVRVANVYTDVLGGAQNCHRRRCIMRAFSHRRRRASTARSSTTCRGCMSRPLISSLMRMERIIGTVLGSAWLSAAVSGATGRRRGKTSRRRSVTAQASSASSRTTRR